MPVPDRVGSTPTQQSSAPALRTDDNMPLSFTVGVGPKEGERFNHDFIAKVVGTKVPITVRGKQYAAEIMKADLADGGGGINIGLTVWLPRGYEDQWSAVMDSMEQIIIAVGGGRMLHFGVSGETFTSAANHIGDTQARSEADTRRERERVEQDAIKNKRQGVGHRRGRLGPVSNVWDDDPDIRP